MSSYNPGRTMSFLTIHMRYECSNDSQCQPQAGGSLQGCSRAVLWGKADNRSGLKVLLLNVPSSQSSLCPELGSISIWQQSIKNSNDDAAVLCICWEAGYTGDQKNTWVVWSRLSLQKFHPMRHPPWHRHSSGRAETSAFLLCPLHTLVSYSGPCKMKL